MRRDRSPRRGLRGSLAAGLVAVALAAGCGGGTDEPQGVDSTPVEDRLGFDSAGIQQRQTLVENVIAGCMKAQGFDYTPVDPAAERASLVGSATLSEEDFEQQFGYGITTLYEQRLREATRGSNAAYRKSLSPAERASYDTALYGSNVGAGFSQAVDSGNFQSLDGCTKKAADEAFGGAEVVASLQTKLDELDQRIDADPRMAKAITEWSACMRESGQPPLQKPDDVDGYLEDKLEDIVGPATQIGIGGPATEPTYDKAELVKLQKEEVTIVKADIECEEQHIEEVEKKVRTEFERTFVDQNADFLASVRKA